MDFVATTENASEDTPNNMLGQIKRVENRESNYSQTSSYQVLNRKLAKPQEFLGEIPESRDTFI